MRNLPKFVFKHLSIRSLYTQTVLHADKKKDCKDKDKKSPNMQTFKIYRYNPDKKETPHLQQFQIDIKDCGPMILDALIKIKAELDPTLTFRRSCREGICGSCGVNVNGQNCLACTRTIVKSGKAIVIYPLPHMYVIKDLVADMSHFYRQYNSIRPYLIRYSARKPTQQLYQTQEERDRLGRYIDCILCACCSTSCPAYWWNSKKYLGPAALMAAYRFIIDSRDEASGERLNNLRDPHKVYRCVTIFNCTVACPQRINPGGAIIKLKQLLSGMNVKEAPQVPATLDEVCANKKSAKKKAK